MRAMKKEKGKIAKERERRPKLHIRRKLSNT